MTLQTWLSIAAIIIIAGLATYGAKLWYEVWRNVRRRRESDAKRDQRLSGDIRILARGLLDGDLPMVEGAIRIKVLLDNYHGRRRDGLQLEIFETIYQSTAHIPSHRAWRKLSRAERELHRRHMRKLERDHGAQVERAARQLRDGIAPPER